MTALQYGYGTMENRDVVLYSPLLNELVVVNSDMEVGELKKGELILSFTKKDGDKKMPALFDIDGVFYVGEF